jgi:hypothetical protein
MDPTALWKMLSEALHELEQSPDNLDLRAHVIDMLEVLARWLRMGGFPPAIPTKETHSWNMPNS